MNYQEEINKKDAKFYENSILIGFVMEKCVKSTSRSSLFADEEICVENATRLFVEAKKYVPEILKDYAEILKN